MAIKTYITSMDLQGAIGAAKQGGTKVGFVPTMGALHDGHLSLIHKARQSCDFIVASIFVNPKQFGPNEDFSTYPRMVKNDVAKLDELGVDAVFLPTAAEMYPEGFQTYVNNTEMASVLCGQYRDNHFQGVLTVVMKLLNLVRPDVAVFGKKDYQQFKLIQRMVTDLHLPYGIEGGEIVRESDGLAMSSRNLKLSSKDRETAALLYQGLTKVAEAYQMGKNDSKELIDLFRDHLSDSEFSVQYAEIRKQSDLTTFAGRIDEPAVCAVAAFLGDTRLIDNIELGK